MRVQIKICGINSPAAFDAAVEGRADWIGFVFFPPSPRYLTAREAARLSARAREGPGRVGLFVEPHEEEIAAVLGAMRLDALQVYAEPNRAASLRDRFGLPVWRAVGVAGKEDLPDTAAGADRLVIEAKPPPGATRPGGNAMRFEWSELRGWKAPAPWILGGGLTPNSVTAAIAATGAQAVDVSSGVETAPGVKSGALIRQFIDAVRS